MQSTNSGSSQIDSNQGVIFIIINKHAGYEAEITLDNCLYLNAAMAILCYSVRVRVRPRRYTPLELT